MESNASIYKRQAIISATWKYLLKTGIAKASVGELCRETKLSQSSLYYWFENKDDIWVSAGEYGVSKVVDDLLRFTFEHLYSAREYFDTLLSEVDKYKYELRLALQITTSPVFGDRMREKTKEFNLYYEQYAEKIVSVFECTKQQAEIFVYSIISIVIDYAIWDDAEKTQMLLDNLYSRVVEKIHLEE